jgi:hypothetical protein
MRYLTSLTACFILIMEATAIQVVAQPLSKDDITEFTETAKRQCFLEQKSRKINSGISDIVIEKYCDCLVPSLFPSTMTYQEFEQAMKILQSQGREAMTAFLLSGRNILDVGIDCGQKALQ